MPRYITLKIHIIRGDNIMSVVTGNTPAARGAVVSYIQSEVLTWANLITVLRLVCGVCMFVWTEDAMAVFILAFVGAVSDRIDGLVAKACGQCTHLGKRLDQYMDWVLGVGLLYVIFMREGFTLNNFPLALMISGYLGARLMMPTANTNGHARIKTGMQFGGGVAILGSYALDWPIAWYAGYATVWISIIWMWWSLRDYLRDAWKQRHSR